MGAINGTNNYKGRPFLHQFRYRDNTLLVFFQDSHTVSKFELTLQQQKYKYWAQQTISLSNGSLYAIGGRRSIEMASIEADITNESTLELVATNEVYRINLSKSINNRIELSQSRPCEYLPEARYNHLLLYAAPFIYVIGGQGENSAPLRSCLRFHTKTKKWSPIKSFDLPCNNLANLAGISTDNQKLYVFDSSGEPLPKVYQYNIETDLWVQIVIRLKNRGVFIPASIATSVFQISENKLLILSSEDSSDTKNKDIQTGFSYFFNLEEEKIEDFRYEKVLNFSTVHVAGHRDFRNNELVYISFDQETADLFDKRMGICNRVDFNETRKSALRFLARNNKSNLLSCGSALCGL